MHTRAASVAAATTLSLLLGPTVGAASPVGAQEPHVSRAEYRAVQHGWKINRVHKTFGTNGRKIAQGGGYATRIYDGWTFCMRVYVEYHHVNGGWRLDNKESRIDTDCAP